MPVYTASIRVNKVERVTVQASSNKQLLKTIGHELEKLVNPIRSRQYLAVFLLMTAILYIVLIQLIGELYGFIGVVYCTTSIGFHVTVIDLLFRKGTGVSMQSKLRTLPLLLNKRREWRRELSRHSSPDSDDSSRP